MKILKSCTLKDIISLKEKPWNRRKYLPIVIVTRDTHIYVYIPKNK